MKIVVFNSVLCSKKMKAVKYGKDNNVIVLLHAGGLLLGGQVLVEILL